MQQQPLGISGAAATREKGRQRIVLAIFVFYLLLLIEGALRKWVLTSVGPALFFIRDPVVVWIYWLALRHAFFPRNVALFTIGIVFAVVGLLVVCLQAVGPASAIDAWPLLAAYGWRNYFLFIPLAFVVGEVFTRPDIERVVKMTLLLALPIALLVLLQFGSPLNSPVNVGFAESTAEQFRGLSVDAEHTRPSGLFTSDVGQKQFVVSSVAMLLALWVAPAARRFVRGWKLMVATGAVLTCLAVSGSRGAMVHTGIVLAAAIASAAVVRRSGTSGRALLIPMIIAVVAMLLYPIVFPEGHGAFMNRWTSAAAAETQHFAGGVWGRAFYGFYNFFGLVGDAPIAGYGLGLAGNASITLGVTIPGFSGWAEDDWSRHIVDLGPIFGMSFILYRVALVIWLGMKCMADAGRASDPLPFLLFAYVGVELLSGQLTGHGSVNGYGWLFAGLCMAASGRPIDAANPGAGEAERPPDVLRFPNLIR